MTDDDDIARLAELAGGLPTIDLDPTTAARIADRARRGAGLARVVEPVVTAGFALGYLAWAIGKIVEALR